MFHRLRLLPICVEALVAIIRSRLALWQDPLPVIQTGLTAWPVLRHCPAVSPSRIAWAINRTASFIPRATCLVRAIAAQHLLARHGHASSVHIGVANSAASGFEAHAWVECNGDILVGRTATEYTPLLNWSEAR